MLLITRGYGDMGSPNFSQRQNFGCFPRFSEHNVGQVTDLWT